MFGQILSNHVIRIQPMNRLLVLLSLLCTLLCVSCQNDSDYHVGTYHAIVTTELSSRPEGIFTFFDIPWLSAHVVSGNSLLMLGQIDRIGITVKTSSSRSVESCSISQITELL